MGQHAVLGIQEKPEGNADQGRAHHKGQDQQRARQRIEAPRTLQQQRPAQRHRQRQQHIGGDEDAGDPHRLQKIRVIGEQVAVVGQADKVARRAAARQLPLAKTQDQRVAERKQRHSAHKQQRRRQQHPVGRPRLHAAAAPVPHSPSGCGQKQEKGIRRASPCARAPPHRRALA